MVRKTIIVGRHIGDTKVGIDNRITLLKTVVDIWEIQKGDKVELLLSDNLEEVILQKCAKK